MIDAFWLQVTMSILLGLVAYCGGRVAGYREGRYYRDLWVQGFDQKVDIVCNACGLVGEFECASCNPLILEEDIQSLWYVEDE